MRVLLCNYEYPPMGGGAGNATANIARELVELGVKPTVLTSRFGDQPRLETRDGVTIYRTFSWRKGIHQCGTRGAYTYLASASLRLLMALRREPFDLVHYFFSLPTGLLSFLPCPVAHLPSVVSLRGSDVPGYDPRNRSVERMHGMLRPITRRIWRKAGAVVALSSGLRDTALKTDDSVPIDVIGNGVEVDLFHPAEPQPSHDPLRFLVVSRLIERKGIQDVIEAVAGLVCDAAIEIWIAGEGSFQGQLEAQVRSAGVGDRVRFLGYRPRDELPELYREADAFLLPSRVESFGMVFVEAMASGLPVIGGRTGGVPDIVEPENGILVTPGSVEEIRRAIRTLAENPGLRVSMGQANRCRTVAHYSWAGVARQYHETYLRVLAATHPP